MIRVANAPCSWGTIERFEGSEIPYDRMLDELREAGYEGTELGDLGYMPTDPEVLCEELQRRELALLGGYEGVGLSRSGAVASARERVLAIADLLASTGGLSAGRSPYLILADDNNSDPVRTKHAGRATPAMSLGPEEARLFAANAAEIALMVRDAHGLDTVFHPHCAGFVERPDEIERFLDLTEDAGIDIVFDTGHFTYGAAEPDDGGIALRGLRRFWDRIVYVHFKDCHPDVARKARSQGWDYTTAVENGIFCELGEGSVDFRTIVEFLRDRGYDDWITVEQDVLPGMGTPKESAIRNRDYLRTFGL